MGMPDFVAWHWWFVPILCALCAFATALKGTLRPSQEFGFNEFLIMCGFAIATVSSLITGLMVA